MDLVSACKDKLAYFRIKELKDVLNQLGLPKQGKKQDLVDRILAIVSSDQALKIQGWAKRNSVGKEAVAKIIDDTYRKMQIPGATDLASTAQRGSIINTLKLKEEVEDSFQLDMRVRCPCGNSLPSESMIQCEDPRCRVWQHMNCVLILEKSVDGVPPVPPQFYCEICRITRADPFWVTLGHPLLPVKLTASNVPTDGTNPVMSVDKTFQLTRADRDLLQKAEYDVQAWCILLNDKVTFRMQWPQYADFQVNGVPIRTTNRPGTQLLGANGRDDGPAITTCTREGINKIILSGCDARIFCLGVRIARRRTVKQVLNLIPKEADGELFEDAVARVCRCIGGGNATDNAGSDSDLEVVADTVTVNLRCPMSGSRMKIVGRFKPCAHMGCFDLDTFVELNQRSRKWQCPICLKNYSLENLIIDPYFNRITTMLRGCGEEVTEIDVKPDGSWRVKNDDEHSDDLSQWHFPDSSLCVIPDRDIKPDLETLKQIKQGGSEGHTSLKLKIKKNHNEIWQVSKPENMHSLSSENHFEEKFVNQSHKIMPMTNSTTGSCREGEDPSVNQDGAGQYCFSANNGIELDSVSMNFESAYGATNRKHSAPSTNADIIILTDSEDDNGNLVSPEAIYATGQADAIDIHFSVPTPGLPNSYPEDPGVSTSGGICLFPCNDNEIGMPPWPSMTSGTQGGTGFQLFGAEADVSDAIVDVQHTSNPCPASLNGYALGTDTTECGRLVPYPVCPTSTTVNDGLVENPLAFGGDDPSLQIFLPARPTGSSVQADLRVHADMSNGLRTEDWISLRLGGGGSDHGDSTGRRQQYASKEGRMETLADTASLILSMSDDRSGRAITDKQRFGGPFSHPRQPRSVRPRLYLSIDSDSD